MTFTHALSTNNYGPAKFIVATSAANGTHTTLASAMAAASSGDTIFLRDTVTENVTLTPGVNICSFGSESSLNGTGSAAIIGTLTMTGAGTCTISGIQLQTNGAALLAVTGSAASIVNLQNCYLNMTNATGITFSSSSASANINVTSCNGDLGTTGIALFAHSSAGALFLRYGLYTNSGGSTTASTISAGSLACIYAVFSNPITTSGTTATLIALDCEWSTGNTTALTHNSTATSASTKNCSWLSGSASAISIGAGASLILLSGEIGSSNTNAITGSGAISYSGLIFASTSSTINVTTQTQAGTLQGSKVSAPTAGMLGEEIRSAITLDSVTLATTATAQNITNISLTAGIWDVTGILQYANKALFLTANCSVGTTSATLGTASDNNFQSACVVGTTGYTTVYVPSYRILLTATTTVYLVGQGAFTGTQPTIGGRISAKRVG